ncbi:MAG TPA: KOW motif-containing protein [Pyrinomonadaceae bacterium]|nr:KOW motif-containing protein [Pyrinomonadaceae bacterium]
MSRLEIYRDRFAESGWEVFEGAFDEARRRGQNYLGVEHILYSLIKRRTELFSSMLRTLSDNEDAPSMLIELIEERVHDAPKYQGQGVRLAAEAVELLKQTLELVRWNRRRRIEATDLFIKMLMEPKSLLHELLRRLLADTRAEAKVVRNLVALVESVRAGRPAGRLNFLYSVDELVRIKSGPFASFTGKVAEIDEDDSTLTVRVFIMCREQPVKLRFLDVEKIQGL